MYTNWFVYFSRVQQHQPRWQFPEKRPALWEVRERRVPQPDWDFRPRPLIREMYRPKPPQPELFPGLLFHSVVPPRRQRYS